MGVDNVSPPKLFISYSWSSQDHEQWVLRLATELRESGVDVILDKWDLREGQDTAAFMEKMVADPEIKKVVMICDRVYAEKANGRQGGVGTEAQIISAKVYESVDQTKFVAVIAERDANGGTYVPVYYGGRVYIDLSKPEAYEKNFEQLARWVFDRPLFVKPEVGTRPAFLQEESSADFGTRALRQRAMAAIREARPYWGGALEEYLSKFASNFELLRIPESTAEFDDQVMESIQKFLPFRDELIETVGVVAAYADEEAAAGYLHRFFEKLLPFMDPPRRAGRWSDWDFDQFRFVIHELFLHVVALLIRRERFATVAGLLRYPYFIPGSVAGGEASSTSFGAVWRSVDSLEFRKQRLKLPRLSLRADLLMQRAEHGAVQFHSLMEADFILFLRDSFDSRGRGHGQSWHPETLLFSGRQHGPFESFVRAQSTRYFEKMKGLFDVNSKYEILELKKAFEAKELEVPRWQHHGVNVFRLAGFDKLATLP